MRVLTLRELNRALLARQLLLRRARLPVARAVERVGALQAQWPPSPYIALWSRLEGFRREQLVRAVERRQIVKATLMRMTLHHVSAHDYIAYAGLIVSGRAASLERRAQRSDVDELVAAAVAYATEEPRSRPELLSFLSLPSTTTQDRRAWLIWHLLTARAELVHIPDGSIWRLHTGKSKYVPAQSWLGAPSMDGEDAAAQLVRRYLSAFGPATRADAAQWSGLSRATIEPGFARLKLRRFEDEQGRELLDVPRAPIPSGDVPAPPRFLPRWDSTLLAYDNRSRILPDEYRKLVIRNNGDVQQTFLVDGFVAGFWHVADGRIELEPLEPLPARVRRELEREAKALAAFHS